MPLLVRICATYVILGSIVVLLARDNPLDLIGETLLSLPISGLAFLKLAKWVLPLMVALLFLVPREELVQRVAAGIIAVFATMAFFLFFTLFKTTMSWISPFWADPMFAELDRLVHFGHDPWALAHGLAPWLDAGLAAQVYLGVWGGPAMALPVLMILTDRDPARVRRFIWLYSFVWIVLGNLLALAFLSMGPVFYDQLLGGDRFAGLTAALAGSGVSDGYMGHLRDMLWDTYVNRNQSAGSGISAFPSVHVGMATVVALYVGERWRWLLPVSVAIVATYLFLSVWLGWHYALDGYASIGLVGGAWAYLRRRAGAGAPDAVAGPANLPKPAPAE